MELLTVSNKLWVGMEYKGFIKVYHIIYLGTLSPLIGVGPQVAMQFATN